MSLLPNQTGPGVVIQIHSVTNVPNLDSLRRVRKDEASDVFLKLQIVTTNPLINGGLEEAYGPKQKTTVFDDVHDAVFGECYHTFRTPANLDGVRLRVKVYDKDEHSKEKIARLDIDLAELIKAPAENHKASTTIFASPFLSKDRVFQTRKMEMDTKRRGKISDEPVSINFRLVPRGELSSCSLTKRFFLIRHGESLWNEAQDENNVMGLLKFDHALNQVGIDQCKALNAAWREADFDALTSLEKEFIHCPAIMCSPLTRCVQTALLSLYSHKTLQKNGMVLQRNLREVKSTLGSLDTLGVEVGAKNIKDRAKDCLLRACNLKERKPRKRDALASSLLKREERKAKKDSSPGDDEPPPLTEAEIGERVDPIELHANDAASKWWTARGAYDDEKDLRARMNALMGSLRYLPSVSSILVGHSLLFRAIMRSFLPDDLGAVRGAAARGELSARKMGNAAVAAVDVRFPAFPEEDNCFEISRVEFLFGSGLAEE